ncbi:MAG TPA: anti-sigma factor [Gemmatimonadales bacterium]|nr:anti-sigma factor [Gemmatimonadales bacterium]
MTDWLGMLAAPRTPRPELKGRVLARALAPRRRWGGPLAAAALITLAVAGGAWWAYRTIGTLTAERDGLATRVHALEDTVSTFIHGPATQLIQIPVSTGGRVGSVTIFADSVRHRWLVRCDGLAPNARDQAYQLWFITERGMATAAVMPMDQDKPMVMGLEMPGAEQRVLGAAMTIEPRAGSASPSGPVVFHRLL